MCCFISLSSVQNLVAAATAGITTTSVANPMKAAYASEFAPGGTLVDYEVGITVGNKEASLSRKVDNSNVIFDKDYYFKFGTAPQWIENNNGDVLFPKTMPFTPSQQRYDTLKKYKSRIETSIYVNIVEKIGKDAIPNNTYNQIADPTTSPDYSIRALGLLANGFLASENTGATNELYLARWYINEIYLHLLDIQNATDQQSAKTSYTKCVKAINSYLNLLNRVITSKVGDKFELISL